MRIEFVARRFALALLAIALPIGLAGCLAIGNRGGLDDSEKSALSDTQSRLNSLEGRVSALEMKAQAAQAAQPATTPGR